MDKIDEKILAALDKDPRIHTTKLAKLALVSQQVADYRMKRMCSNGTIVKFGTVINLKSLGLEQYRIFFTFNAKKEAIQERMMAYLRRRKGVYWAARVGGKYELLVVLFVKDFEDFDHFIDEFNTAFPGLIKDYKSCYGIEYRMFRHKYLGGTGPMISYGYNDPAVVVDDLDKHILGKIKDDCRISSLELAQHRDISYKTIINRIRIMEKQRIILGRRLMIHSHDEAFVILLSFKNYAKSAEKNLLAHLGLEKNVTQLARLFGIWNICLHVRSHSNEHLQQLIIDLRDRFDIIDEYEIIPIFEDISINLMPV